MSKPVVHTQLGNLAITRAKLLFVEAMTADDGLTPTEVLVGLVLVNRFNTTNGYGETSLDFIARARGIDKSVVCRAVNALEQKGWFTVDRGTYCHGGRGNPNRYYPQWDNVPSRAPLDDAAERRKGDLTPPPADRARSLKGDFAPPGKGDVKSTKPDSLFLNKTCANQRAPRSEARMHDSGTQKDVVFLKKREAYLKAERHRPFARSELSAIESWRDRCDEIFEERDLDDPVGRWACRLAGELQYVLELNGEWNEHPSEECPRAERRME
jgi:hypothetical protein